MFNQLDLVEILRKRLGESLLAELMGKETSQLKDSIQASTLPFGYSLRLDYLAKVILYLQGSYNDKGIKHWFDRPKAQLNNQSPVNYLSYQWFPQDDKAKDVLKLAQSLLDAGVT